MTIEIKTFFVWYCFALDNITNLGIEDTTLPLEIFKWLDYYHFIRY